MSGNRCRRGSGNGPSGRAPGNDGGGIEYVHVDGTGAAAGKRPQGRCSQGGRRRRWFSAVREVTAVMERVHSFGQICGQGGQVLCRGVQHPGSAAFCAADGDSESVGLPTGNCRGFDLQVQVGVTVWAPGALSFWLVCVAGHVPTGLCGHGGVQTRAGWLVRM